MTPLEAIKAKLDREFIFIDPQHYLDNYEFIPYYTCGEIAGYLMVSGQEVHIIECPGGRITRRNIRDAFMPLLKDAEWLWTKVLKEDSDSFITRFGFKKTGGDGIYNYYRIDEVRYA